MKNTKEILPILTAIYCINRLNNEDKDIAQLCEYALLNSFNANTNMLMLACIGQTKETAMPYILKFLQEDTNYLKYLNNKKDGN